jgi:nucleotide sugar dehydrogenase
MVQRIMLIGIIGQGFVGTAVREGLKHFYETYVFDLDINVCPSEMFLPLKDIVEKCDIIFQCLPTPMKKSGECDLSTVRSSLENINQLSKSLDKTPIIIIKSTVPPGTCEKLNQDFDHLNIVFSPEFLTEANATEDFKNQNRIIVGGPRPYTDQVKSMFRKAFPHIPIVKTGYKTAEMVKYFINNFLSVKVSFANEMYQLCNKLDIDYDKVTEYALFDQRIGRSHLSVPGPDGDFGFGGHCFPKDLDAMIYLMIKNDLEPIMLEATREKNNRVRKNRDWEKMKGRAVSED